MIFEIDEERRDVPMCQVNGSVDEFAVTQHLQYNHSFASVFLKQQIVLMGLNFGVLVSIILKRSRKSRLTTFRQQLAKGNKEQLTLIQYPAKIIFCIIFFVTLAVFVQWFAAEIKVEITQQFRKNVEKISLIPKAQEVHQYSLPSSIEQKKQSYIEMSKQNRQILQSLRRTLNIIHLIEVLALTILLSILEWKIVRINKRDKIIQSTIYRRFGFANDKAIFRVKQEDKLQIWQLGQTRFTNTNYYYSIRIVSLGSSLEIIRRSNIYSSRTTIISLSHILSLPYTTKIIKKNIDLVDQQ